MSSTLRPRGQQFAEFGIASWRRHATKPLLPCPQDKTIARRMFEDGGHVPIAVAAGIFQLDADFAQRLAFPRQLPMGPTRSRDSALSLSRRSVGLPFRHSASLAAQVINSREEHFQDRGCVSLVISDHQIDGWDFAF